MLKRVHKLQAKTVLSASFMQAETVRVPDGLNKYEHENALAQYLHGHVSFISY